MLTACATRQVAAAGAGIAAGTAAHMVCPYPTWWDAHMVSPSHPHPTMCPHPIPLPPLPTPSPEPRAQAEGEEAQYAEALRCSEETFRTQVARQPLNIAISVSVSIPRPGAPPSVSIATSTPISILYYIFLLTAGASPLRGV